MRNHHHCLPLALAQKLICLVGGSKILQGLRISKQEIFFWRSGKIRHRILPAFSNACGGTSHT
ncbi:hypothetical protein M413DRAFT_248668 [Hebeloma cylindrosporum]|uniref:Uncharacterized protein n=1 Tax=Hebeloma cylindrosporum TaxID=76867 RepID=A0A0C2XKG7_HEBCY|nr:hypothetical protein M413DRAFT_248668 [Hebeloma cylindrosporum h7]